MLWLVLRLYDTTRRQFICCCKSVHRHYTSEVLTTTHLPLDKAKNCSHLVEVPTPSSRTWTINHPLCLDKVSWILVSIDPTSPSVKPRVSSGCRYYRSSRMHYNLVASWYNLAKSFQHIKSFWWGDALHYSRVTKFCLPPLKSTSQLITCNSFPPPL